MFCPLTIAYARTIHKFQGLSAGPVDAGRQPNMYDVVVCDPDEKSVEGSALGLLYTAVSRGTTLGDDNGLNSAVYFTGSSFKPERIRHLTHKSTDGKEFHLATKRRIWVNHLKSQAEASLPFVNESLSNQQEILDWANNASFSYDDLFKRIEIYKHRNNNT